MEDFQTRHKKELKVLDGEKRSAIKKAKAVKGKKGKDALTSVEVEFEEKFQTMLARHKQELLDAGYSVSDAPSNNAEEEKQDEEAFIDHNNDLSIQSLEIQQETSVVVDHADNTSILDSDLERSKKLDKARRKRDAKKEKERQRKLDEENAAAMAGPSLREVELQALYQQLQPLSLQVVEIPSDGNCLYRAVAAQCGTDYCKIRQLCADQLQRHQEEYAPFCEYTDSVATFDQYVDRVRSSSEWGGHLELRALSEALQRTIIVYSATQPKLILGQVQDPTTTQSPPLERNGHVIHSQKTPILLSYHLHYYTLGEHYNQVVKIESS